MTNTAIKAAQLATKRVHFGEQLKPEDIAYCSNIFMIFGLPALHLKDNPQTWTRKTDLYDLTIIRNPRYEIPTGPYARMNQIFIDTEVKTKNTNVIDVGRSFYEYTKRLGYKHGGAEKELVKQLVNYVTSALILNVKENMPGQPAYINTFVSDTGGGDIFFDVKNPDQLMMGTGKIILNEKYARYIHKHAVPLDMEVIRTFKRNPLFLDFYRFLAYRCNTLNKTISFPDHLLFEQLGTSQAEDRITRARLKQILRFIQGFWPVRAKFEDGYFELQPSPPAVQAKIASRAPLSVTHNL